MDVANDLAVWVAVREYGRWTVSFFRHNRDQNAQNGTVADAHPSATVTGVDLSPMQPTWVAPNAHFVIDDVEARWTYPENHFDFIFTRVLLNVTEDVPKLVDQCYR